MPPAFYRTMMCYRSNALLIFKISFME